MMEQLTTGSMKRTWLEQKNKTFDLNRITVLSWPSFFHSKCYVYLFYMLISCVTFHIKKTRTANNRSNAMTVRRIIHQAILAMYLTSLSKNTVSFTCGQWRQKSGVIEVHEQVSRITNLFLRYIDFSLWIAAF